MEYKFHCPHCGQRISASTELIGTTASCPTCNQGFVAPHDALPLAAKPKTFRKWIKRAVYAVGLLVLSLAALSLTISILSGIWHPNSTPASNPVEDQFAKTKQRTIAAWRRMQEIDTQMLTYSRNDAQQAYLQHSFLLSQIDLDSVDLALVEHLRTTIAVARRGADLAARYQAENSKLQRDAVEAQQFVGQLSNLADTRQQAAGVNMLGGLLLQGAAGDMQQTIERKYQPERAAQSAAHFEIQKKENELAEQFTKKYGVPFITAM